MQWRDRAGAGIDRAGRSDVRTLPPGSSDSVDFAIDPRTISIRGTGADPPLGLSVRRCRGGMAMGHELMPCVSLFAGVADLGTRCMAVAVLCYIRSSRLGVRFDFLSCAGRR